MVSRLEIKLKSDLTDAEGEKFKKKAKKYFNMELERVRTIKVMTIDASFSGTELGIIQEIFTNPITQVSSYAPIDLEFDWCIWIGFHPGVQDNVGSTAIEVIEDIFGKKFCKEEAVYMSKRFCITASNLEFDDINRIAGEFLANNIIQQWEIFNKHSWDKNEGIGLKVPKVMLNHTPTVDLISINSNEILKDLSDERNLALNSNDIPIIRQYFLNSDILADRIKVGLSDPTDIELEYISQARSDHCNHNTFQGLFKYKNLSTGKMVIEDNPFKKYIKEPTLALQKKKDWVISVLWDNAGVGKFDDHFNYTITGETHNSPSNMEAYGGAITGIVGVYRDLLGTGMASKLIMGSYGYCVGDFDYRGELKPHLYPSRLLEGIIEGVKDGGNKSGIPTTFGQIIFNKGYIGKSLVYVTALGIMPSEINNRPSHKKTTTPGELIVMLGGRVGKDGIHGVTASSEIYSENIPAEHVQIGDPYTQKKMHDFILEARDLGLIEFITDNGGGGLSSSIGESAELSNGCEVWLDKVPLKYEGLDQWEIWISESQERMTLSIKPDNLDCFMKLSEKHAVESTVIGKYTDSGKLHILYNDKTCAYVNIDFLKLGFTQWEFEAEWQPPSMRGLFEPVINEPKNYHALLLEILQRPNICSKEWIVRQYDHEVQGTSVIKPLVGMKHDVNSDASVIRPVLDSKKGLAFAQALLPMYSQIDTYHMTTATIDEAVRRIISIGGTLNHISGVDNFCWPDISFDQVKNPDGKYKAAQLIRSCRALKDLCEAYGLPLLSGKDSMYVDGYLKGPFEETRKISALPTIQFSTVGLINNVSKCVTMDAKEEGNLVYILGVTKNELGGSEYYERLGYVGLNVPKVNPLKFNVLYRALTSAIAKELIESAHGIYRGGLGVHLAMVAMGGHIGMTINITDIPVDRDKIIKRYDTILFSETPGRFIVTINSKDRKIFEKFFKGLPCQCIGHITGNNKNFVIKGFDQKKILSIPIQELKKAWKKPFREMI